MKIVIGLTELAVIACYPFRYQNGKTVLRLSVAQDQISHAELKTLLNHTAEDITYVKDDGKQESYSGFASTKLTLTDTEENGVEIYKAELEFQSDADLQVSVLKSNVNELTELVNQQKWVINELTNQLTNTQIALCEMYEATLESEV